MVTGSPTSPAKLAVVSVIGTRPEAIKMAPVALALRHHPRITHRLIASGQQAALFDDAIAGFGVTVAQHVAHATEGQPPLPLSALQAAITQALTTQPPQLVLVQGDTNSALAAARAAAASGIMVGHVEAGLRTHVADRPFPEESNRIEIAQIATLHFAPSARAAQNLARERVGGTVHITGNTGIDALMMSAPPRIGAARSGIVVTCHRRENFGAPALRIASAIDRIAALLGEPVTVLLHPNPHAHQPFIDRLGDTPNVCLRAAISYRAMISALANARLVISDSGGIQEECAALGTPLLVLRCETERPEVIESGNAVLVGSDPALIVATARAWLTRDATRAAGTIPAFPYGRGDAAPRIVAAIERLIAEPAAR